MPQQYKARGSIAGLSLNSRSSIVPTGGERLWKPLKYGEEYTTSAYGILKLLIIGMSVAAFICLMITTGGQVHSGRYACFFASTSVTGISNILIFFMSRLRVWDPRRPSLPHQIERLNGFIFVLWNFVSAGLVAPTGYGARLHPQSHVQPGGSAGPEGDPSVPQQCLHNVPIEICRGSTTTAAAIAFLLSATILVNFFLSVWWGPPLRYSMRLKNITEGEKYQNFTNEETIEELQEQ
jgi:hypothetical protein